MRYKNINEVITSLQSITAYSKLHNMRMGYFAALYTRMTVAVKKGIEDGIFEDAERMELLDICFAERYISAWECYSNKKPCTQSWQYAFDSTSNSSNIVLQHLLLGINTHINLDLAIAAATIAPGARIDALEKDFNCINNIIASLIDDVQECLSQVWFPMRLLTKIVNGKHEAVLNFSIDKARAAAWSNAVLLANMTEAQQNVHIKAMDNLVRKVACGIENPGSWTKLLLKLVRKTEFNDPQRTIHLIETIVV